MSFQIFLDFFGCIFCYKHKESPLQSNPRIATIVSLLAANGQLPNSNKAKTEHEKMVKEQKRIQNANDWQTFATIMDRIFFTLYVVVIIFSLVFYFPWSSDLESTEELVEHEWWVLQSEIVFCSENHSPCVIMPWNNTPRINHCSKSYDRTHLTDMYEDMLVALNYIKEYCGDNGQLIRTLLPVYEDRVVTWRGKAAAGQFIRLYIFVALFFIETSHIYFDTNVEYIWQY